MKTKYHCFFEQSGTFKNEFRKFGYDAFSLIYALADKGIINLEHENMEEEGVKLIL